MDRKIALSVASLRLKNAAPEQWDKFLITFADYMDYMNYIVADADASQIMIAKGFALQCRDLYQIFRECEIKGEVRKATS